MSGPGYARSLSVALIGLEGTVVEVEADIGSQIPAFTILGLPDASVQESRDRVRSAARNAGIPLSPRRITVNLSPATLPKRGSGFDLAIAMAALQADGQLAAPPGVVYLAEVSLDGALRPVRGVLPAVLAAVRAGYDRIVVATANAEEAALVTGAQVRAYDCLADAAAEFGADPRPLRRPASQADTSVGVADEEEAPLPDLCDVAGQAEARMALEIAAAGSLHLLLTGPPGAGKSMLASRLPSILPELDDEAATEVTAVRSLETLVGPRRRLIRRPPFEAPDRKSVV